MSALFNEVLDAVKNETELNGGQRKDPELPTTSDAPVAERRRASTAVIAGGAGVQLFNGGVLGAAVLHRWRMPSPMGCWPPGFSRAGTGVSGRRPGQGKPVTRNMVVWRRRRFEYPRRRSPNSAGATASGSSLFLAPSSPIAFRTQATSTSWWNSNWIAMLVISDWRRWSVSSPQCSAARSICGLRMNSAGTFERMS